MNDTQGFLHINSFFEQYAQALERYDSKAMVQHYAIPCTFMSNHSSTVFKEASKLEGLFNQGIGFYKQFDIVHARPEVWSKRMWTDRIAKVKINWQYFDSHNRSVYNCDYQYILRLDKQDNWKIELAVSINEKEQMEAWQAEREK